MDNISGEINKEVVMHQSNHIETEKYSITEATCLCRRCILIKPMAYSCDVESSLGDGDTFLSMISVGSVGVF
jgi:hypothetical protein